MGYRLEDIVVTCVNHWPVAIETHKRNHPEARHYVQDIATVRPHIIVPEGYLDLFLASPTCTHHSVARGGKPTSDQQRADPWHIIPWFTELRAKRAIIENVWEFTSWGPVDPRTGKPVKSRKGEYFRAWVDTIQKVGATSIEWRKLNAADYGGATTRQRFIMKIRFDRVAIGWAPLTHRKRGDQDGKLELFPTMKPWRAAREIIDWSIKGKSIFNRPVPLAPKTLARILAGATRFNWPRPLRMMIAQELERSLKHSVRRAFGLRHVRNAKARASARKKLAEYIAWLRHNGVIGPDGVPTGELPKPMVVVLRQNANGRSTGEPLPAILAEGQHLGLAEPVILNGRRNNKACAVSTTPVPTLDTKGGVWLAEPFVLGTGSNGAPRETLQPLPTITTGGAGFDDRPGCARPALVEPFLIGNRENNKGQPISGPAPTATTAAGGGIMLVEPFILSQASGGAPRSTRDPLPTAPTDGAHALIAPYYSNGSGQTCTSTQEPLPSAGTKARFGMVVPITHSGGGNRARDVEDDPLPTLTTANRGELAFITAQFGEREGQAPRVHDIGEPTPGICAQGHINLVEATAEWDCLYRMLEPPELAAAMGFNTDEAKYEFVGTKTDQIKQIGNAVSVEMMEAEVRASFADIARAVRAMPAQEPKVASA